MNKTTLKTTLTIVLVLALVVITGLSFAYWDSLEDTKQNTITIGEGTTLTVNAQAEAPEGKTLVPSTVVAGSNDVTSIELKYNVNLSKAVDTALNLKVNIGNLVAGTLANPESIVNITATATYNGTTTPAADLANNEILLTSVDSNNVLVVLTISIDEPTDQTTYDAIYGQVITFDLLFEAYK